MIHNNENFIIDQNRYSNRLKSHHETSAVLKRLSKGMNSLDNYIQKYNNNQVPGAVYVHVPFCNKICSFCNMQRKLCNPTEDYADLIVKQIEYYGSLDYVKNSVYGSVYFGGGTPTTLDRVSIRKILRAINKHLPLTKDVEVTFETTITELTEEKISTLMEEGVNRLSIGVQTFSDEGRKTLGRIGNSDIVYNKLEYLKKVNFPNINIDIIYNYPNQKEEDLIKDINNVIDLNLSGFSFYSLILNDGSTITKSLEDKEKYYKESFLKDAKSFNLITNKCLNSNFEFLELTKIVRKDGDKYKYIKTRYLGGDTLPIGAGAGGNLKNLLMHNSSDIKEYRSLIDNIKENPLMGIEISDCYMKIKKLMGQIQFGVINLKDFENEAFYKNLAHYMDEISLENFAKKCDDKYIFNLKGMFWGNNISSDIIKKCI